MSKAASTSKLNMLHEMLTEVMMEELQRSREEHEGENGTFVLPPSPALLGVIRQFLKDNNISAGIDADDMASLRDEFRDELAAKREAKKAQLNDALRDDMADIFN